MYSAGPPGRGGLAATADPRTRRTGAAGVMDVGRVTRFRPGPVHVIEQEQARARARDDAARSPRPGREVARTMDGAVGRVQAALTRRAVAELGVRVDRQPDWMVLAKIAEEVEAASVYDAAAAWIDAQRAACGASGCAGTSASASPRTAAAIERSVVDRCLREIAANLAERRRLEREVAEVAATGLGAPRRAR